MRQHFVARRSRHMGSVPKVHFIERRRNPTSKEPTMNTTTTLTQRTLSLLLAATATLVMVLAIDGLAQHEAAAGAQLAQRIATTSTHA
jgi:hypothetical protein